MSSLFKITPRYESYMNDPYRFLETGRTVRWFGVRQGVNIMKPYNCHFQATIVERRKMMSGKGYIYTLKLHCDGSYIDEIHWSQMVPVGMESNVLRATGILIEFADAGHGGPRFSKDVEAFIE